MTHGCLEKEQQMRALATAASRPAPRSDYFERETFDTQRRATLRGYSGLRAKASGTRRLSPGAWRRVRRRGLDRQDRPWPGRPLRDAVLSGARKDPTRPSKFLLVVDQFEEFRTSP
jgi:hypothetical protein